MPWSIFTQGGGQGAALTWARDLLAKIGAPDTPASEQVIDDWEVSEGGGGAYNPLNQGPVPGHPELTTTGSQYGGGAADFAGWDAGLQGAADYLSMPNFSNIKADLVAGNATQARADIIEDPWAGSHYNWGASFSSAPVPGHAAALPAYKGSSPAPAGGTSSGGSVLANVTGSAAAGHGILSGLADDLLGVFAAVTFLAGGVGLVVLGVAKTADPGKTITQTTAALAAAA